MKTDQNLYFENLSKVDREFVESVITKLYKYESYLYHIIDSYHSKSIEFDYTIASYSSQLIYTRKSDNKKLELIYGDYAVSEVYEYNPKIDKSKSIKNNIIKILDCNPKENSITLERLPTMPKLLVSLNISNLKKQLSAIYKLKHEILSEHINLFKLFYNGDSKIWREFNIPHIDKWFILTDDTRPGVDEQRKFVKIALSTTDFAFLDGPPGSGKTTVLCELVLQLISKGKRILFCASTHVAVDNLLERLVTDKNKEFTKNLIPLRVGNSRKISDTIKDFQYDIITDQNESEESKDKHTKSQKTLLNPEINVMGIASRHYANLVCGTTIGLVKYFKDEIDDSFDYMIIDEASKTTFQEFLAPAVHAKRWVIVGDVKQLNPYTDQNEIAANISAFIDKNIADCCLDVFMAYKKKNIIVVCDEETKKSYKLQYKKYDKKSNFKFYDADKNNILHDICRETHDKIIVGSSDSIARIGINKIRKIFRTNRDQDIIIRNYNALFTSKSMVDQKPSWDKSCISSNTLEDYTWAQQISWRVFAVTKSMESFYDKKDQINEDYELLLPNTNNEISDNIDSVKDIAMTSILELAQSKCFNNDAKYSTAFKHRNVILTWQHRMHSEVASFSHKFIYKKEALKTPDYMANKRKWSYDRYPNRCIWIGVEKKRKMNHVKSKFLNSKYANYNEAELIIKEIRQFYKYACNNPKSTDTPQWDIAIQSFYTDQFNVIQKYLRRFTGQQNRHSFSYPAKDPKICIELRTVDSFQGHESDIVFLSISYNHPTYFLNNPNRINVALTRARYQCVIVGNYKNISKKSHTFPLKDLTQKVYHVKENDLKNYE